jgi:hypothetical protein
MPRLQEGYAHCHAPCSECTTREAHKNNFIARLVVCCNETISFPDILALLVRHIFYQTRDLTYLRNTSPKNSASNYVSETASTNTWVIVHDLALPIRTPFPQGTIDSSNIRGNLNSGIRMVYCRPRIAIVAIDPSTIQT